MVDEIYFFTLHIKRGDAGYAFIDYKTGHWFTGSLDKLGFPKNNFSPYTGDSLPDIDKAKFSAVFTEDQLISLTKSLPETTKFALLNQEAREPIIL